MTLAPLPDGPFGAILADPPWAFRTYNNKTGTTPHRGSEDHYSVMSFDELTALPVGAVAARDCVLFMWVVDSHLDTAIDLGATWGFTYKTIGFIWFKTEGPRLWIDEHSGRMGMGYWTRKGAECCLLFTRGKPARRDKGVRQVIPEKRREHSRKPDRVHDDIQRLVSGPYLELFARAARPGWSTWGDETNKYGAST